MRKMMILSLIAVILGVGLVLAQQASLRAVTIAAAQGATNSTDMSLAQIAARGEVTVRYTTASDNNKSVEATQVGANSYRYYELQQRRQQQISEALLLELSAQGFMNLRTPQSYDFTCGTSPELRELSAQGLVTVNLSNLFCTA